MKIVTWNVNGIRAITKNGFIDAIKEINPDVICLQEIKAEKDDVITIFQMLPEFEFIQVNSSKVRKGYSGTATSSKIKPRYSFHDIGIIKHDQEGRVITTEFDNYYLVNVYVPNSKRELKRLDYRQVWDRDFLSFLKKLEKKKPVIACGDFNVAHTEIDLANPKSNYNKTAGFTQQEIDGFQEFLDQGFTDVYRHFNPEKIQYTYWSYMFNARKNNKGWRIDYFLCGKSLLDEVINIDILDQYPGSDHCPVLLEIKQL